MKKLDSRVRITETDDISDRLILLYDKHPHLATDPFLNRLFNQMRTQSFHITEAIKHNRMQSKLGTADALRNQKLRKLRDILKGYRAMPIPAQSMAADALWTIFSKYGIKIVYQNYASKSSLLESLLLDFAEPGAQAHVNTLPGMAEALSELRHAQSDFTVERIAYETYWAHAAKEKTASELKKTLLELINDKLLLYVETMRMVDPDNYTAFAATVEQIIEEMNDVIARRSGR